MVDNIYYLKLSKVDSCSECGNDILEELEQLNIPIGSRLIFDGVANNCQIPCNDTILSCLTRFKSIAYIVKHETATHDPWEHAMYIRSKNNNTQYCDSYEEAYNWSLSQEKKEG